MIYIFGIRPFMVPFIALNFIYFVTKCFKSKILVWIATILIMIGFDSSYYNEFLVRMRLFLLYHLSILACCSFSFKRKIHFMIKVMNIFTKLQCSF